MRLLLFSLLAAVSFACSDSGAETAHRVGADAGEGGREGTGGSGTGGGREAGAPDSGGGPLEDSGDSEPPLVDPDEAEPCVADPDAARWSEESLSFDALGVTAGVGLGGGVTLLAARTVTSHEPAGALYVTSSSDGATWADPLLLSDTPDFFDPPVVRVARDGSAGIVLWVEDGDAVRYATWLVESGFSAPRLLDGARTVRDVVALAGGTHAVRVRGSLRIIDATGQQSAETPLPDGLSHRMFLGPGERPVLYVTSVLVSEGSSRYEYSIGNGFGPPEAVPLMAPRPSGWQEFWFEAATGVGARIVRSQGTHVTVRRGDLGWTAEEQLTSYQGDVSSPPTLGAAGTELVFLWPSNARVVERAHDGNAWSAERAIPRSSNLELAALAGTNDGVGLVADLTLEGGEVSKLFRRGSDGTWYCPRLARLGFAPTVASAESGELVFVGNQGGNIRLVRFRP